MLSALSTLIATSTQLQDAKVQIAKILLTYTKKSKSFASLSASITAFTTHHTKFKELVQKAQSFVAQTK